jgi:hypothetical protein
MLPDYDRIKGWNIQPKRIIHYMELASQNTALFIVTPLWTSHSCVFHTVSNMNHDLLWTEGIISELTVTCPGSVTNNKGFWIGWLDLLALLLQLQSIMTAHNEWLYKIHSIPYWTTSVFSSAPTDLILINESLIYRASAVHWLAPTAEHYWTEVLNCLLNSLTT